jgi:hypothetical protein
VSCCTSGKTNGKAVKYLRLDNAGENKSLQQRAASNDWKLNLTCEFTARNTPQQNPTVELGLADVSNKGRAVMIATNVPLQNRYLLYHKAFEYVTDTDGLRVITRNGKLRTRYAHFGLQNPPFAQYLRTWGGGHCNYQGQGNTKASGQRHSMHVR